VTLTYELELDMETANQNVKYLFKMPFRSFGALYDH